MTAKQAYLDGDAARCAGIDRKALLEATLYGLPMLRVNLPAGRHAATGSTSIVGSTTPRRHGPRAATLGLTHGRRQPLRRR